MKVPGSLKEAKPDDYVNIIHGGNKARTQGFVLGGNGESQLETIETLKGGKVAEHGLQFHSLNRKKAPGYASMSADSNGGSPAVLEARIKRKYLYANSNQGNFSDEYGLPTEYFNKLKDIKIYNPNTGETYSQMANNANRLPYGRTKTPGVPPASQRVPKTKNFVLGSSSNLTGMGNNETKEAFKSSIKSNYNKNKVMPVNKSLVVGSNIPTVTSSNNTIKNNTNFINKQFNIHNNPIKDRIKEQIKNNALKNNSINNFKNNTSNFNNTYGKTFNNSFSNNLSKGVNKKLLAGGALSAGTLAAGTYAFNKFKKEQKNDIERINELSVKKWSK